MSKQLSLKLREDIFEDAEKLLKKIHIPRNTFINQAVKYYTEALERVILKQRYKRASKAVAADSMEVLKEFEALLDDYE